jgi:apolipoprotein N-acyltransferase
MAIYTFLTLPRKSLFWGGFFTGILWFWWVSISFIYYDLIYLMPLVVVGFGFIYAILFISTTIYNKLYIRAILLFILSFISPFNFNWFKPELIFINSYINTSKISFAIVIISISLFIYFKTKKYKFFSLVLLILTFNYSYTVPKPPLLKIAMPQFNIDQNDKWDPNYKNEIIKINFARINDAIKDGYDVVILPETAFPLLLNLDQNNMQRLKDLSKNITIITGAMHKQNNQYHNSTYKFFKGEVKIAHKVVLVPFGEEVPAPQFITDFINKIFFNGAKDYTTAKNPTDFEINNIKFRNAICYETTTNKIYKNSPNYVISISNNAWFTPSIEPTLQKLLMKYYAKKYNLIIYSSSNKSKNNIIM